MDLPLSFIRSMNLLLGADEFEDFQKALSAEAPVSIRLNKGKPFIFSDGGWKQVPWCPTGYYLPIRPSFTFDPLFHAGVYYVQVKKKANNDRPYDDHDADVVMRFFLRGKRRSVDQEVQFPDDGQSGERFLTERHAESKEQNKACRDRHCHEQRQVEVQIRQQKGEQKDLQHQESQ